MAIFQSDVVITNGEVLHLESGETLNNVTVNNGEFHVNGGATADNATVNQFGSMLVLSDGKAENTTVNTSGSMTVSGGGTADNTKVDGGYLINRGTVNGTVLDGYGYDGVGYFITSNGGVANDTTIYSSGRFHLFNGTANNTIVNNSGDMMVYNGGVANSTTVNSGGSFGTNHGTACNTTVKFGGFFKVAGGAASNTVINSSALCVVSWGAAYDTVVNPGGRLLVSGSGTAINVFWTPCEGKVETEYGAYVTYASQYSGVYYGSDNHLISNAVSMDSIMVGTHGEMFVMNGGTATNAAVESGGSMTVSSGGRAVGASVSNGGLVSVSGGGAITGISVDGGELVVLSGGTAMEIMENGGAVFLRDETNVTFVSNTITGPVQSRTVTVHSGTTANSTTLQQISNLWVYSGGIANDTTVEMNGYLTVCGGTVNHTVVNSYGAIWFESDGVANDTTLNRLAGMSVSSGGTVSGVTVSSGAGLTISSGARLTGQMTFEDGAVVSVMTGSILDFDISGLAPDEAARVNDLSFVQEAPDYTLTVSGSEISGIYLLAGGASAFNSTITVQNTPGERIEVISVGETFKYEKCIYTLELEDDVLRVSVTERDLIPPVVSNILVSTTDPTDKPVTVTADFTDNNDAIKSALYRFDEDGEWFEYADGITVCHNGTVYLKAIDTDDNESEIVSCTVENIGNITGLVVSSGMDVSVFEGETFLDTVILADGSFSVEPGGTANGVAVNAGGRLDVYADGVATDIAWTPCEGSVYIAEGATATFVGDYSGVYYGSEGHLISHAATMDSVTLDRYGEMYVMTDGVANHATFNFSGHLDVSSGGIANDTVINSGGSMTVFSQGAANGAVVNSTGRLYISSGGTANNTLVDLMGTVYVSRGGVANSTTVSCGGIGRYRLESFHALMGVSSGGTANNTILQGVGARLAVSRGGVANSTTVDGYACNMVVQGSANDIDIQWGSVDVSGGAVNNVMVNSNAGLFVYPGCSATGIVENGGFVDDFLGKRIGGSASFVSNTFSGLALGDNRWATVHSGTTACDTTVAYMGWLCILSGGIAYDTVVQSGYNGRGNSYGVHIFSGGTANGITVNPSGYVYISSGGTAVDATILSGGTMVVSSGTVNSIRITDGARLTINRGSFTGRVLLQGTSGYSIGNWFTYDLTQTSAGGIALLNDLSLAGGGDCTVTVADDQAAGIYSLADGADTFNGRINLYNTSGRNLRRNIALGETVEIGDKDKAVAYTFFLSGGDLYLAVGCDVPEFTVTSGATVTDKIVVNSGEIYDSATVSNGGSIRVSSGGTATRSIVKGDRIIIVSKGGLAKRTEIQSNGILNVFGGLAVNTVNSRGAVVISGGGSAYNTTVRADAILVVSKGGTADASIISGGSMLVSGGAVNDTIVYNGQGKIENGGVANRTMLYGGAILDINSGGIANHAAINESAAMNVSSGGTANSASVSSRGSMHIVGGGVANNTIVFGGSMTLDGNDTAKGSANATIVYGAGRMNISNGGVADDTTVYGMLTVSSGGTATNVKEAGGYVDIKDGAVVAFASHTFSGRTFYASATVHSGTTAVGNIVFSSARVEVFSGGIVERTLLGIGTSRGDEGGILFINSGGTATDTNINGRGSMFVSQGGAANDIKVNNLGMMSVFGTADDTMVNSGGDLFLYDGATVNGATVNGGRMRVSGGTADGITVNSGGSLFLFANGAANGIVVSSRGRMNVSGGTADGVTVNSAGSMFLENGGRITGEMTFANGAVVSANGGVLDFDLTRTEAGGAALVNDLSIIQGTPKYTITVSDTQASGVYTLAEGAAEFKSTITVQNTLGETLGTLANGKTLTVGNDRYTLDLTDSTLSVTVTEAPPPSPPENLITTPEKVSWESSTPGEAQQFIVEYSTDNFEHVIQVVTTGNAVDTPDLPVGTYQWRVKADDNSDWAIGEEIVSEADSGTPKVVQAVEDGSDDLFFATPYGTWSRFYYAHHVGSINDWNGTNELLSAGGRGRIRNLFFGSSDPNVLCLTDGENGDAIFVDDIYTELPEEIEKNTARLYRIQEIRAGAGDDIVDMTSQQFEYTGDGLTIRGGDGDDVIWANKGENCLFGDAGDDRIVGASGNDFIVGGIGNDTMHGGGGDDTFTFCDNWGTDIVKQIETGTVTLWFASGDESNWNAEMMTYTDGENSVTVSGVTAEQVALRFGVGNTQEDADRFAILSGAGAFDAFTSRRVFEESGQGLLATP